MVRTVHEENIVCGQLRKKYFENPKYRKWSDIIPLHDSDYGGKIEDFFFMSYITGKFSSNPDPQDFYKLLDNGHDLPIDWSSLYAYFDNRFADDNNCAKNELIRAVISGNTLSGVRWSVMDILNHYRNILLSPSYDMV